MCKADGRLSNRTDPRQSTRAHYRIIELLGPPGAGKTALLGAMLERDETIQGEIFPYFRHPRHIPFFVGSFLRLSSSLPSLFRVPVHAGLTRRDLALMTILWGWPARLKRRRRYPCTTVLLEEGGLCLLAKLRAFGSAAINGPEAQVWWARMCDQWAGTLDVVIRLDAPAATLVRRVRSRRLVHEIDALSNDQAAQYLERIRNAQTTVLSRIMRQARHPSLLEFNTTIASAAEISENVLARLAVRQDIHGADELPLLPAPPFTH